MAMVTMNLSDYAQPTASTPSDEPAAGPKAWSVIQSVQFPLEGDKKKEDRNVVMGLESIPQFVHSFPFICSFCSSFAHNMKQEVLVKSRWLKYNGKLLVQYVVDQDEEISDLLV